MDEHQIERLAGRLGERAAARLDVERAADAVLRRLRAAPARPSWWRRPPVLVRGAAAVALLATAGIAVRGLSRSGGAESALTELLPRSIPGVLETLSAADLADVLDSLTLAAPVSQRAAVGLYDLSESQLRELLSRMEG